MRNDALFRTKSQSFLAMEVDLFELQQRSIFDHPDFIALPPSVTE